MCYQKEEINHVLGNRHKVQRDHLVSRFLFTINEKCQSLVVFSIGIRARSDLTPPECLIVEIRFLLPQNVRKKHSFTILKSHKIRNMEFLEPHIIYVGLLDLVTNKNL